VSLPILFTLGAASIVTGILSITYVTRLVVRTRVRFHLLLLVAVSILPGAAAYLSWASISSDPWAVVLIYYSLNLIAFLFVVFWGQEFTRRMERISATADFELGLPMPSRDYQFLGAMGKLVQELAKPIVAVLGTQKINQKILELSQMEPLLRYMEQQTDGSFHIDPRVVPLFHVSDSVKEGFVELVDLLVQENASMAGRISRKELEARLRNRAGRVIREYHDVLIESGLLDRLGGGIFSDQVSSGITDFDIITRGGYPKGSAILLCGPPSDARDLMLDSFLGKGLSKGDPCIYVSSAQPPEMVYGRYRGISDSLIVVDCYTNRIDEVATITRVGNVITSPIELSVVAVAISRGLDKESDAIKRAVVDILPTYLVFQKVDKICFDLIEIINDLRKAGYTVMFSLNPYFIEDKSAISTLEELFDGVIYVERTADASGMKDEVSIRIEKMASIRLPRSTFSMKKPTRPGWDGGDYSPEVSHYSGRIQTAAET
jgi:KaiC/GvpD/RAD55 family RecA-like ATPase